MKHIKIVVLSLVVLFIVVGGWWLVDSRQTPSLQEQTVPVESKKTYSLNEVATHSVKDDCWTIINDSVYDLTPYINRHPGGEEVLRACGRDATTLFMQRRTQEGLPVGSGGPHSPTADEQLAELKIGTKE